MSTAPPPAEAETVERWPRIVAVASATAWLAFAVAHGLQDRAIAAGIEFTAFVANGALLLGAIRLRARWLMRAELILNIPALSAIAAISGGTASLAIWWLPLLAMSAALVLDRSEAIAWACLTMGSAAMAAWLATFAVVPIEFLPSTTELVLGHSALVVTMLFLPWLYRTELAATRDREHRQMAELRRSYERVASLHEELVTSRRQLQDLLKMMHHSLRTSTTAAAGAMELLAERNVPLPEREQQLLDIACRHTALLRDEIRDLLDARELLERDDPEVSQKRTDLARLIRKHLLETPDITGSIACTDSNLPEIDTDPSIVALALRLLCASARPPGRHDPAAVDFVVDIAGDGSLRLCLALPASADAANQQNHDLRDRLAILLLQRVGASVEASPTDARPIWEIRFPATPA